MAGAGGHHRTRRAWTLAGGAAAHDKELQATSVVAIDMASGSAKIRTGPPADDEADYALPIWAGVLPLREETLSPIPDERLPEKIDSPSVRDYNRRG